MNTKVNDLHEHIQKFMSDRDYVLENSIIRLKNRSMMSEEMLSDSPYYQLNDMFVTPVVKIGKLRCCTTMHALETVIKMAPMDYIKHTIKNSQKQHPIAYSVIEENLFASASEVGAGCFLYDGFLDEVYERVKGDFYIDFFSPNYLAILPADELTEREYKKHFAKFVRATRREGKELLSESIYKYNREIGDCEIIEVPIEASSTGFFKFLKHSA